METISLISRKSTFCWHQLWKNVSANNFLIPAIGFLFIALVAIHDTYLVVVEEHILHAGEESNLRLSHQTGTGRINLLHPWKNAGRIGGNLCADAAPSCEICSRYSCYQCRGRFSGLIGYVPTSI